MVDSHSLMSSSLMENHNGRCSMADYTDPNQVRLTGENQYMRLHTEANGPMTTRCSHWRILLSPWHAGCSRKSSPLESSLTRLCRLSRPSLPGRATVALSGRKSSTQ